MPPAFSRRAMLMRAFCIFLCCALLGGLAPTLHAAPGEPDELLDLCKLDALPQDIRGSLSRNFAAWKVLEPADLTARARTRWGSERPLTCPGIAAGHFQDPKNASYALLLIPANHSTTAYKVLIYTQQSGGKYYGFKAATQMDSGAADIFLHTEAISRYFDSSTKWARSKVTDAVMVADSAAAEAYLYLWSDTNYDREQVNFQ